MISLISVVVDSVLERYFDTFKKAIIQDTRIINEVILPKVDSTLSFDKEWIDRGIKFRMFSARQRLFKVKSPNLICMDHAFGLHAGINEAANDYVMLSDPDVFFYTNIDEFYYQMMQQYNLNLIGLSHFSAVTEAFGFFPNVFNMMLRKSECPPKTWLEDKFTLRKMSYQEELKDEVPIPGMFLVPGEMDGYQHEFPNPKGHYETGSNLLIWAKQANWRWMSFQTTDCHNYSTQFYRTNFGLRKNLGRQKLVYHATNGSVKTYNYEDFLEALRGRENDRLNNDSNSDLQQS